jgi:hypothetical protein
MRSLLLLSLEKSSNLRVLCTHTHARTHKQTNKQTQALSLSVLWSIELKGITKGYH